MRWLGIIGVCVGATTARAEPCPPSARVAGDRDLVLAIEPILRERGITVLGELAVDPSFTGAPTCRLVTARIAPQGRGVMVWLADGDGHQIERMTEDAAAAATVIESWTRHDLVDPLFASRSVIRAAGEVRAPGSDVVREAPARRFTIAAGADSGLSGDGALWAGMRAQGCATIGPICLGGVLRYAIDLERSGDSAALESTRTALDVTVTVELPVRRGRFVIAPGAGLGLGAVTASRDQAEDPMELEQASALHARAACGAALQLSGAWSLRADLAIELAPFARDRLGEADGVDRQLAGSPKLQTWLGLGIAYGVP